MSLEGKQKSFYQVEFCEDSVQQSGPTTAEGSSPIEGSNSSLVHLDEF
jgi:hypothetical protein